MREERRKLDEEMRMWMETKKKSLEIEKERLGK